MCRVRGEVVKESKKKTGGWQPRATAEKATGWRRKWRCEEVAGLLQRQSRTVPEGLARGKRERDDGPLQKQEATCTGWMGMGHR